MTDIGEYNERLVLHTIRSSPEGIGQSDVVRRSGLSRQAVSLITRRLIAEGMIEQAGRRVSGPGKPHTLLRVVADARLTIGVHLDPAHITVVVCDLAARPVARATLDPPTDDPQADIARIASKIDGLALSLGAAAPPSRPTTADADIGAADDAADAAAGGAAGTTGALGAVGAEGGAGAPSPEGAEGTTDSAGGLATRRRLLGIGIAAPAGLDATAGILRDPPWMPGWRDIPIVEELSAATGLPAVLGKDTNAALTGEIWSRHLESSQTVLYMYVGHGVGSAISANGAVHRGGTTQAGEIGHLPIGRGDDACNCGRYGCLCLYTDAPVLVRSAQQAGVPVPDEAGMTAAIDALAAEAERGSEPAQEIIAGHGRALGEAIRILAGIHDPQRVIIGGPTWPALRALAERPAHEQVSQWLQGAHATMESSHLGDDIGAIGAACLFLDQELAPGSSTAGSL
ncbi:ROK family transcriptional regulator [Brachybacterium alimentarium]|uniref:ROK family transcriptional regulator n=1 Tax=Brachybacterium alimentarium TaxID=47845 RepID=UPI003FCFC124